jgi:hypothetical protein
MIMTCALSTTASALAWFAHHRLIVPPSVGMKAPPFNDSDRLRACALERLAVTRN